MKKKMKKLTKEQKLEKEQRAIWQEKMVKLQAFLDREGIDLRVDQRVVPVPRRRR